MEFELTQEKISKSVLAAYDSVNLINELKAKSSLTEEETKILSRNQEHIRVMMTKNWFSAALTNEQIVELQAI